MRFDPSNTPEEGMPAHEFVATTSLTTHNGQRLSPKEDRFITLYIQHADSAQAAKEAGYSIRDTIKNKDAAYAKKGYEMLAKDYIKDEIAYRMEEFRDSKIADTKEILMYLTGVMRGDIKDQFNLEASISDRTAAAKELNRRIQEIESNTDRAGSKEVHLVLRRE